MPKRLKAIRKALFIYKEQTITQTSFMALIADGAMIERKK